MDHQTYVVARAKQVFAHLEKLEERLEAEPESFLTGTSRIDPMTRPLYAIARPDQGSELRDMRLRIIQEGRSALTKIRLAGEGRPELTPEEAIGLEAIVLMEGRPAILIKNGRFEQPPSEWEILDQYRDSIEQVIPRVGRIEVEGHPRMAWVGTGFLVGPNVILTNRHVAVHFVEKQRNLGWVFTSGIHPRIDFNEEFETTTAAQYAIMEVIHIHNQVDMALIRVAPISSDGLALPNPLTVHLRTPRGLRDRKVYVIGFPAWDGRRNDPSAMQRIFADIYNVKRLQPGTIRNYFLLGKVFKHDCSTLGGNSGSCVVDLETGKIIGLHFAGRYGRHNSAIALWTLRRSVILKRAGVHFG
jgi:V8-like Glu-specific endopeptidase